MKEASLSPLGLLIRSGMTEQGVPSIRQLSSLLGLSYEQIRNYLQGVAVPPEDTLGHIASVLNISPQELRRLADIQRRELSLMKKALDDPQFVMLSKLWTLLPKARRTRLFEDAVSAIKKPAP